MNSDALPSVGQLNSCSWVSCQCSRALRWQLLHWMQWIKGQGSCSLVVTAILSAAAADGADGAVGCGGSTAVRCTPLLG